MQPKKLLLGALGVVVLIGIAHWTYRQFSIPKTEPAACAQEALLCPDGSSVGRIEPQCQFSACPNQPFFIGTLRQNGNGFTLSTVAPENNGRQEVAYTLPLQIKMNNVQGQLIGKKVKVSGAFTEGATLVVDRLEELPGSTGNPTVGKVGVGKSVFINGVLITLNKVLQDSRCPIDSQCIQAGWVTMNVTLKSDTGQETREMATYAAPIGFDSYQIFIEDVQPLPRTGTAPDANSYQVTFRVHSLGK